MEPVSAFYKGPLLVLDFQSLYPSVMVSKEHAILHITDQGYR
jgi:DNA polymerase elongation subunit (family B)